MIDGRTYLSRLSEALVEVQRPIRILKAINWDSRVHEQFFAHRCAVLPRPSYSALGYEPRQKLRELAALRKKIRGRSEVEKLLRRKCDEFSKIVEMLASRGTKAFYQLSLEIYGGPRDDYADAHTVDNLAIARLWAARPVPHGERAIIDSARARAQIEALLTPHLGDHVKVRESNRLTANAAAGATTVAVRKGALFTARQVRALAHHEGLWHVLTSANGYAQPILGVLGVGLPHFTESQEGGGIVSEFLTGNLSDDRFRELGERTIAVDLAAQGADFIQVFEYLAARFPPEKAAQMAERVFRGGLVGGGAPFTKDAVYQRGYCRVFNFLRAAFDRGDHALVQAFLAGKMAVDDAPLIRELIGEGLAVGPRFLPAWYHDHAAISAQFTHSVTIDLFDHRALRSFWEDRARPERSAPLAPARRGGAR